VANTDLSAQFEKISDQAKTATNNLRAASQRSRNQLAVDAASARDKATAAANQLKGNAVDTRNKVSSQWQEIRDKWQAHVAKVQTRVDEKADQLDARVAAARDQFEDADVHRIHALQLRGDVAHDPLPLRDRRPRGKSAARVRDVPGCAEASPRPPEALFRAS